MFNNKIEGMNMPAPKQNFGIKDTTAVDCPECHNTVFQNGVIFRKVSKILAGTDKDGLVPINVPYCVNCLEPLQELLPIELRKSKIQFLDSESC
jgi:hypothetical protein